MWKRGFDASLAKELVESHEQLQQSLRDRRVTRPRSHAATCAVAMFGFMRCLWAAPFRLMAKVKPAPSRSAGLVGERSLITCPTTKTILHKTNSQNNIPTYRFTMTMGNPPLSSSIPGNLPNCILHFEPV